MNTLHTPVDAWIRMDAAVTRGRPFPFGEFSCTPLTPGEPGNQENPVGFLLARGNEITWVDAKSAARNTALWDSLVEEMHHWQADPMRSDELPPECWYG
ncbi:MAG: hypothetical protein IT260_23560 [Saprospiraceae bacterium]|nr:hypothetical protein [Saprospiraceae bacterium]